MHMTRGTPLIWVTACPNAGTCVEVAALPDGGAAVRDGKNPGGPVLLFDDGEWTAFLEAVRAGRFDFAPTESAADGG